MKNELKIEKLPLFSPRNFVPEGANLCSANEVEQLFKILLLEPMDSASDFKQWLLHLSEFEAALSQQETILYIQMTCQTDDEKKAQAYTRFIEDVEPIKKSFEDKINHKYLESRQRLDVDSSDYEVLDRSVKSDIDIFREENVPLVTQDILLSQNYQTLCGAMTVSFDGKEQTLPQMSKYLLEPDRALREKAWRLVAERRLKEREKLDRLFDEMLTLRHTIARQAGLDNFRDYQFKAYHRFDYTPSDCKNYHDAVGTYVVPIWQRLLEKRRKDLGLERLRPWDLGVDPAGRPPLKPFSEVEELISKVSDVFGRMDSQFHAQFKSFMDLGLLDLASHKGKAPGGYQSTLAEARKPFIFMNAVGTDDDVRTLLHEAGHAFHVEACAHQPLYEYRHGPMEFNEVASMSMELMGGEFLSVFYGPEDERRSQKNHLEDVVYILIWVAIVDKFQHWLYENPFHSQEERQKTWVKIYSEFGKSFLDWEGLEGALVYLWHRQLHIFEAPFYYIEYGIAQIGALQVWANFKKDPNSTLRAYKKALALGGSRPLPEIFATAGLKFDFSKEIIRPLAEYIQQELLSN